MPPTVKNLMNGVASSVAAPVASAPIAPANPVANAIAVPSFLSQAPAIPAGLAELPENASGPYVAIATARSGKWNELKAAGLAEGDFYLRREGDIVKLMPLRMFVIRADLFKTKMDSLGNIVQASRDMTAEGLDEHVTMLLIVFMPDGTLVPCTSDMRRTAAPGAITALRGLEAATDPAFASTSPAHAVAAAFPLPAGRVVMEFHTSRRVSRTSGNPYYTTSAHVAAAKAEEMKQLSEFLKDEASVAALTAANTAFEARVENLSKVCK